MGSSLATSFANTASTSTSNAGLGGLLAVTQGISSIATLFGGGAKYDAAQDESKALMSQGVLAVEESEFAARQKQREVRKFAASQVMQFAKSGVSLEGTPLMVLQDTLHYGQEEVDAIRKRGDAVYDLYSANAKQTRRAGRNALIGSGVDALTSGLNTFIGGKRIGLFNTKSDINNGPAPIPSLPGELPYESEVQWPGDYA